VWAPDGTKINPIPWLARHGLTFGSATAGGQTGE
jgi:hypothetical protein